MKCAWILPLAAATALASCTGPVPVAESESVADSAAATPAGCSPAVLPRGAEVLGARRPDAAVLARIAPGGVLFLCEAAGGWRRVLFADPPEPGQKAAQRTPGQINDCDTRPAERACRSGWVAGEPAYRIPG